MTVDFAYGPGDDVLLKDIQRPARVRACSLSERGLEYQVTFWSDGERRLLWVYFDEVERMKNERDQNSGSVGLARVDPGNSAV